MTATADNDPASSNPRRLPWLSIWFRPGDTIEQMISVKSWLNVLLLAGLGGAFGLFAVGLDYGWLAIDWRNLAILTVVGFVAGVAGLFFNAFFFRLWGMLLGGHASQAHIRAALAWSMVPNVFGFVICLAAVIGLMLVGAVNSSQPAFYAVEVALKSHERQLCSVLPRQPRQGKSGLGLEAQRQAVLDYLDGGRWKLVGEFTEVESGKRDDNRPALAEAFKACRVRKATLVIARLDRLSRDAHFLLGLQKEGVQFVMLTIRT